MNKRSRTTYSLINMFANFSGYAINLIISFICRVVFVHCLTQEYLGLNGLFSNILSMLSLSELGIGTAIVYAMYKPIAEEDHEKIASLMQFYGNAYKVIGCVIAALGFALIPFIHIIIGEQPGVGENLYYIYGLYLFNSASSYFFSYRISILTASQRNYIVAAINYLIVIIQNIIQIIVLMAFRSFTAYLFVQIVCGLATNIITSWKAQKDYPFISQKNVRPLDGVEYRELVKNIKSLTIYKLSGMLVNNTDNIVITYFDGLVTTGAASNYTLFSSMLSSMVSMIFGSMTASVGNMNASESDETKYRVFCALNFVAFWLYSWCSVGIFILLDDIVRLFFGQQYVLGRNISIIIAINFYIQGMQTIILTYKSTMGLFSRGRYILLFTAILNIVGDILFGAKWGLFGILLATVLARVLSNAWYEPYVIFRYGFKRQSIQYLKTYFEYIIITAITAISCLWLCSYVERGGIWVVLLKSIIVSAVSNAVIIVIFWNSKEMAFLKMKGVNIITRLKKYNWIP